MYNFYNFITRFFSLFFLDASKYLICLEKFFIRAPDPTHSFTEYCEMIKSFCESVQYEILEPYCQSL